MDKSKYDNIKNHSNHLSLTHYNIKKNNFNNTLIPKIKKQRNSNDSPSYQKNYFEINEDISTMKRSDTHYNKNRDKSFQTKNLKKFKNPNSIKDLEHSIMNKILDISMRIEEEEGILSPVNNDENNLNLSTLVKSHIDEENNMIYQTKKKSNNKLKLLNKSNNNLKLDISKSSAKNSKISNNDNIKINHAQKTPATKSYDKYRILYQKNILYDSLDSEEEKKNQEDSFYISPKSKFALVFDFLILIFSLFDIIYTPLRLSKIEGFCSLPNNFIIYIYYCIDILYIIDLLLGFFRSYYNFQFIIINNSKRIIYHYIVAHFWSDFLEAIPAFSYIVYLCKKKNNIYCNGFDLSKKEMILLLLCFTKNAKILKIINIKNNSIMFMIKDIIAENEIIEEIVSFFITIGICISCFYSFISIHIFIGRHSYPNWIIRAGFQDKSHLMLYLISFYYLITTMTTVGYGDIVGASLNEIIFQIIVLTVGITIYSWVVSNIGNYVKNESYASMQFNKDETILEEIRISYPNMSFKLYKNIYHHLHARKIRQKQYDSNLLINSLPYSLKNAVLLTMYKETINNLKIFKNCQNSDFIVRLLTNFIPLFSKKNAILIHEGQSIENIIFIKNGILALQAAIEKDEPEDSIKYYLCKIFAVNNNNNNNSLINLSNYDESSSSKSSLSNKSNDFQTQIKRVKTNLYTVINKKAKNSMASEINESGIGKEMGKWDYGGEDFDKDHYHFLNIIRISKNESFGVVNMILDKPCPFSLRVKSKKAELLLLRKVDACDISQRYPNIWMKFFKKSYYNTFSINNIAIQKLKHYWDNLEKNLKKNKTYLKRCNSNKNLCCIYRLNDFEVKEISKILNGIDNTNKRIQRAKTQIKIKANNNNGNIKRIFQNNNKKSDIATTDNSGNNIQFLNSKLKSEQKSKVSNENKIGNGSNLTKESKLKSFAKTSQNHISSGNLRKTELKSNISKNNRKNYINKLKIKIKKLENSNKYYKSILKEICTTKEIDENLLLKLQNNNIIDNEKNEKENNFNIYFNQNINQNIINNITINNNIDNKSSLLKKSLNFNELEYESTISESPRKFDADEIKIKSEIKLFYKAKYTNLEMFTSGKYSKNEKLQKQCLNYLQLYLETDKKTISKKNNRERRKSSYIRNYDFREMLNQFNIKNQRKKEIMNNKFLHNNNNENNIQELFKKFKKNYFQKRNNKSKKFNLSLTPENRGEKCLYSNKENIIKNNRKRSNAQSKGNNEDIPFNQSDIKIHTISIEKNKNTNIGLSYNINSCKKMNSFGILKLESCNALSSHLNDK